MRISHLTVSNFLGLPRFDEKLAERFLFVAGPNGAGKSSLHDAIRFCLLGELPRGAAAGKRDALITDGAARGFVELTVDGFQIRRNIGSGKAEGDALEIPDALGLCLDAPRFAHMPENDRRKLLFQLAGVKINRETVDAELGAAGLEPLYREEVLPLLRSGFPAACDYARDKAKEARGEWKGVTGEAYGRVKAATWAADAPTEIPSDEALAVQRERVQETEARLQAQLEAKGRVDAAPTPSKLASLRAAANAIEERGLAVTAAEKAHTDALEVLQGLTLRSAAESGHLPTADCPACNTKLQIRGTVLAIAPEDVPRTTKTRHDRDRADAQAAAQAAKDALDAARAAANEAFAAGLALEQLKPASDADHAAVAELEQTRHDLDLYRSTLRVMEDDQARAVKAKDRTERAMAAHERAAQWELAEAQLGPDGIPAVLLARALDPVNAALAAEAAEAGFKIAAIQPDLTLTYGGRPYWLCSESEQWRASALFALVVAQLSGVKVLALDRFDCLQTDARGEVVSWLLGLVENDLLDFVLVTATLAKAPAWDGVAVRWLGPVAVAEAA